MESTLQAQRLRWAVATAVVVFLLIGAYQILQPFMAPIAWAVVLCFATWPLYRQLSARLGHRDTLAALAMTLLLLVAVVLPVLSTSWLLAEEVQNTAKRLDAMIESPPELPPWLTAVPILGPRIESWVDALKQDPQALQNLLTRHSGSLQEVILQTVTRVGRNLAKIALTLLTAYFFYRYGEELLEQTRNVAHRFTGEQAQPWIHLVGGTIRAVVYGLLLTALAQGTLAGLGYVVAGVPAPVLLGVATCFLALVPFGAPLVWVPAGLWLLGNQQFVPGIALLLWGTLVVSTIDNVLRPYFISGATRIPYLLVFFGVLGGAGAFGLIGIFIGPIILSVLLALWRKWASAVTLEAELHDAELPPPATPARGPQDPAESTIRGLGGEKP
jgi:predicted PurR-regulated permease PerM